MARSSAHCAQADKKSEIIKKKKDVLASSGLGGGLTEKFQEQQQHGESLGKIAAVEGERNGALGLHALQRGSWCWPGRQVCRKGPLTCR